MEANTSFGSDPPRFGITAIFLPVVFESIDSVSKVDVRSDNPIIVNVLSCLNALIHRATI